MAKVTALQLTIRTVRMTYLLDRGDKSAQSRGTQKSVHSMPRTSKLMLLTGSKYRPEDDARAILAQCIRVQLDRSCVQFRVVFVAFGLESACFVYYAVALILEVLAFLVDVVIAVHDS